MSPRLHGGKSWRPWLDEETPGRPKRRRGGGDVARQTKYGNRGWRAWLIAAGWLMLVWFALWGAVSPMLALAGALATGLTLLIFPLTVVEFDFGLHPWRSLVLIVRFLADVTVASLEVGWLAIRPGPGPASAITSVQLRSTSDLIQTLTAMAVSLVPGSLIIDADPDNRVLVIHVLNVGPQGLPAFHQRVLDQEERIVRALGGKAEIDAIMGGDDVGDRAMHSGSVTLASPVMIKASPNTAAESTEEI